MTSYGELLSKFECKFCAFNKEFIDKIDESSLFVRNEECKHYSFVLKRKSKDGKSIRINIVYCCKNCKKEELKEFTDLSNTFKYKCNNCDNQKELIFSYTISLIKENNKIFNKPSDMNNSFENKRENNFLYNKENDKLNNKDNKIFIEEKGNSNNEDLTLEDNYSIINGNLDLNKIEFSHFPNISEENKIVLILKYYKKTEKNYYISCSKVDYLSDIIKEFKNKYGINKITYAICNGKRLDGERTIKELKLRNKSLIFLK